MLNCTQDQLGGKIMRAINKNKSLQDEVELMLDDKHYAAINDEEARTKAKIQRLRKEMRKYLGRPQMFSMHIEYLRNKIAELEG